MLKRIHQDFNMHVLIQASHIKQQVTKEWMSNNIVCIHEIIFDAIYRYVAVTVDKLLDCYKYS